MPAGGNTETIDWNSIPDEAEKSGSSIDVSKLSSDLSQKESGGDYTATNKDSSATGKYQFLWGTHGNDIRRVTGVKSRQQFLNDPNAQEEYFKWHVENNLLPSVEKLKEVNKAGYSDEQLAKLVHFKGAAGAREWLQSGKDSTHAHNTSIDDYIGKPEANINWDEIPDEANAPSSVEKKSPDVSAGGSAGSFPTGPGVSSESSQPLTEQGVLNNIFGKDISGNPIVSNQTIQAANAPAETIAEKTNKAVNVLANDFLENEQTHPEDVRSAFHGNPLPHEDNPLNQVTNPAGDPVRTAQYFKGRKLQLTNDLHNELASIPVNPQAPQLRQQAVIDITNKYNQKINELQDASQHMTSMQLFQKEYTDKPLTPAETNTKLDALAKQRENDIRNANKQMQESSGYFDLDKADEIRRDKIATINKQYQANENKVKSQSKWDSVRLGIEQKKLLGDPMAEQDAINYDNGRPIPESRKYQYQVSGNEIKKTGLEAAQHNEQHPVVAEATPHIETPEKIEADNIGYLKSVWANKIANEKYKDENPLFGSILPHIGSISQKDLKEYGAQAGLTPEQIKQVSPEDVPTSATWWQKFGKGALNTAASLYEQGIRAASSLVGGDQEAINEHFQPGWEDQRGLGAAIVGNMPTEQNATSLHNIRGVIGQAFEGAGGLATFAGEVGGAAKALEATGLASSALSAEKAANFGVMAFSGYNNAYHDANEIIGDKPEDEWKRQGYAMLNGIVEGKIFSISPKSQLVKNAIGVEEKSGEQLLNEIKKAKSAEVFATPEFKDKMTQYITEIAKENGTQVSLAVANELSKNAINTLINPKSSKNIPDEIKNTAVSTAIAMSIPSIIGGIRHVNAQTPLNKAAMFEVGSNPNKYTKFISDQLAEGKISPEDAQVMHEGVLTMKNIIKHTPTTNIEGRPMTPDQVKDYSFNLFQEQIMQQKADALSEGAKLAQIPVDKAQMAPINKRIGELQNERADILKKAGETKPPLPIPEVKEDNSELKPERSVATEAASEETTPAAKKSEEKVANSEKEDIPLISDNISEQDVTKKTTENEQQSNVSKIKERGQDSSEERISEDERTDSEVQKATDDGVRNEGENSKVTPEEKTDKEVKAASETEQPLVVKEKKKKRFAFTEEPLPEPVKKPEFAAWDQGEMEGQPKATHEDIIKNTPSDEKIGGGESFEEFRDRIHKSWEDLKKEGKDKTLLVTHSGVMKMIESAEAHGWDNTEELRKAYNEEKEPPVGEVIHHPSEKGEILVARHGESEDNAEGLLRTKEAELTDKGRKQAKKKIADKLKEEGIKPSEIISSDLPRASETADIVHSELTSKKETDASVQSKEQQQESHPVSGEQEYARTEQAGSETAPAEAKNSDSNIGGEAKEKVAPKKPLRNQSKKGWSLTAHLQRRERVSREPPQSIEEHILQTMISMSDKAPDKKWNESSLNDKKSSKKSERNSQRNYFSDDPKAQSLDQWAEDIVRSNGTEDGLEFNVGEDSSEIAAIADQFAREFTSKQQLLDHLESLQESRKENQAKAEEGSYFNHDLAQMYADIDAAHMAQYDEEHPVSKAASEAYDKIDEAELTPNDEEKIKEFYGSHYDEKTGTVNYDAAHSDYKAIDKLKEGLSSAGESLMDDIVPFNSFEQHSELIQKTIKDAELHESKRREESAAKVGTERESTSERSDIAPDNEAEDAIPIYEARLKEIDENLLRQKASQAHEGNLRSKAERAGDIPGANKHNDNWYKKQSKIDKLNEQRDEIIKERRREQENEIKEGYRKTADKIRAFGDSIERSGDGMLGSFPLINPKLAGRLISIIGDLYEKLGNLHLAIHRGIEQFKGEHPEEKIDASSYDAILPHVEFMVGPQQQEPVLSKANESIAKEALRAIQGGEIYDDIFSEIRDDEDISENTKAKVLNYLEWNLKDKKTYQEQTLREPKFDNKYLDSYPLTSSDETSYYLSGKTLEDVHGKNVDFDISSKEKQLQDNLVNDTANMVGLAKYHAGSDDVLVYGTEMLGHVKRMPDGPGGDTVKKLLAVSGLNNELNGERIRLENELSGATPERVAEINNRLKQIRKMSGQAEVMYRDITSNASDILNAARANRIFRNTYFHDLYADKILSEEARAAKDDVEANLNTTKVPDAVSEDGPLRPPEKETPEATAPESKLDVPADKDVETDITSKEKKERAKKKSKSFIDRVKEKVRGKKLKEGDTRKIVVDKSTAEKKANEYLHGGTIEDLYKKAKEQTKKPC